MSKQSFLDRLIERLDAMDSNSIQAYILRLSREKGFLETIFNAIHEGIIVIDRKLKIGYYNKVAKKLLGIPESKESIYISQFLRDIDWKRILKKDEDEWYKISRQEIEVLYPKRRILQFYLVPHGENSGTATVILNDITESRERVKDEFESQKLHIVSMLAAGVAHEIGNPLNSLSLHLQLLQKQFASDSFEKDDAVEIVDIARQEVERLDTIIQQFLNAVRPASPDMQPLDLKETIVDALNFMRQEIENRSVEVKCAWAESLPLINGDIGQLKQAFYNILKNSIQAMPEGGSIDINCSYDDDFVELAFVDTGTGISVEDMSEVFEPYHTSKEGGSGLGLMIVERIMRDHGAEVALDSGQDGTVFTIRFPRHGRRVRVLPAPDDVYNMDSASEGEV